MTGDLHHDAAAALPPVWRELAGYKSPRTHWTPGLHWLGLPTRSHWDRLARLAESKPARKLLARLAPCTGAELSQLLALATINAAQAEIAFRRAFVINISAPFAVIVAFGQLAPETFAEILTPLREEGMIGLVVLGLAALILFSIGYAYIRAADARDLRDLVQVRAAALGG